MFVWVGVAEVAMEQVKSTVTGVNVGRAMLTDFEVLSAENFLSRTIELPLAGSQKDFQ